MVIQYYVTYQSYIWEEPRGKLMCEVHLLIICHVDRHGWFSRLQDMFFFSAGWILSASWIKSVFLNAADE